MDQFGWASTCSQEADEAGRERAIHGGRRLGLWAGAALLGCCWSGALTSTAAAETIPLPTPAPLPKEGALPSAAPAQALSPAVSGLAAGFNRSSTSTASPTLRRRTGSRRPPPSTPDQRAQVDKVSAYLSSVQQLVGQFRPGRPGRQPRQRRILYAEARQGSLRIRSAEPDRDHRRRPVGGRARPQARHPGPLPAVADAAALPALRPHRPPARHQRRRRPCRRRLRHHRDRGEAAARSAPAG